MAEALRLAITSAPNRPVTPSTMQSGASRRAAATTLSVIAVLVLALISRRSMRDSRERARHIRRFIRPRQAMRAAGAACLPGSLAVGRQAPLEGPNIHGTWPPLGSFQTGRTWREETV